jgi:hypothetical protein
MMMMMMFTLKILQRGCHKSNPTHKCRPAKGISKRVNSQMTNYTDIIEQSKYCHMKVLVNTTTDYH